MNNLDMVVNLQTWVILLEFFGIGHQPLPVSPVKQKLEMDSPDSSGN